MREDISTFHLRWRVAISVLFICMWLPVLMMVGEITTLMAFLILLNIAIPLIGVWVISVVSISSTGITLYHINKLKWSEVVEAKKYKIFGIDHIRIKRRKGMPYSLPLYFIGKTTLVEALLNYAPKDNSLYQLANEINHT